MAGQGFFLGLTCTTRYVKVAFLHGAELDPVPPIGSKDPNTRHLHILENSPVDETQFTAWIKQAMAIPDWVPGK